MSSSKSNQFIWNFKTYLKLKAYRVISLPKNCTKKKTNNFNHREYCWDCQTRLECLLVSLVQLQLVTYSNEVKPYIHPLHEKSYTGATSIRISVIQGGSPKQGLKSSWQWYWYWYSRSNRINLLFLLTFCFSQMYASQTLFVCRFLG